MTKIQTAEYQEDNEQESHAIARKLHDVAVVHIGLKFADIHYMLKSSQAPKARLQSSRHTGTKQNITQNGHSTSRYFGIHRKATTV